MSMFSCRKKIVGKEVRRVERDYKQKRRMVMSNLTNKRKNIQENKKFMGTFFFLDHCHAFKNVIILSPKRKKNT